MVRRIQCFTWFYEITVRTRLQQQWIEWPSCVPDTWEIEVSLLVSMMWLPQLNWDKRRSWWLSKHTSSVTSSLTYLIEVNWKHNRVVTKRRLWKLRLVVCFPRWEKKLVMNVLENWIRLMRHWSWQHVVLKVPLWMFLKWWQLLVNRLYRDIVFLMDFKIVHCHISPRTQRHLNRRVLLEILSLVVYRHQSFCFMPSLVEKVWLTLLLKLQKQVTCHEDWWSLWRICLHNMMTRWETHPMVLFNSHTVVMD